MRPGLATTRVCLALVLVTALGVPGARPVAADGPPGVRRLAQAPDTSPGTPITLRGTIVALEGQRLRVATASGEQVVTLVEPLTVIGATGVRFADITPGTFVGTAARPEADGIFRAIEVHLFPESMRGTGEGHRARGLPGTTMTNATVEAVVQRAEGLVLTLKYQTGEVRVVVPPDAPIVRYGTGDRGLIVPGASIVLARATPMAAGRAA